MISELRRYRIKPGRIESWLRFFAEAAAEQQRLGIRVEYVGVDTETNTFTWIRSFDDEASRRSLKDEFYGSAWWQERESVAMDHVLGYDVTFLDAALVRGERGELMAPPWPAPGAPAGSEGDEPPDGWTMSTNRAWVPMPPPTGEGETT